MSPSKLQSLDVLGDYARRSSNWIASLLFFVPMGCDLEPAGRAHVGGIYPRSPSP